jgi:hypothetical protein
MSVFWKIFISIVVTILVVGGGIFDIMQRQIDNINENNLSKMEDLNKQIQALESSADVSVSVSEDATSTSTSDWKTFKSTKFNFGYSLSYPSTYTVSENSDGGLAIKSSDGYYMFGLYTVVSSQSNIVQKYMDSSQEYMTSAKQSSVNIVDTIGVRVDGVFGKNAGIDIDHSGISGSSVIFTKNNRTFILEAYDNGDQSQIFSEIIQKLTF